MQTGAPCIPVSIYGTETLMAKGKFGIKPGTAHIVFHAPVDPADYATREELSQAVREVYRLGLAGVDAELRHYGCTIAL